MRIKKKCSDNAQQNVYDDVDDDDDATKEYSTNMDT